MTKSREQLVNRALRRLGYSIPANADEYQPIDDTVESMFSNLATRGIYQWGDPDQIDDDAFEDLAELLAILNGRDAGLADGNIPGRKAVEDRLKELAPIILSGKPLRTEYF